MQEAEALAPDESNAHMFVGDAYRAQKNLEKARAEYLRGHALEPRNAVLLVKAGHANTFLGDYAAARADYDSAMALGRANEKAAYAPRSEEHTSELQSQSNLVCRLLLEKKKKTEYKQQT